MKNALYIRPVSFEPLEDRIAPATFIVTNLDDAGAGSLRDAVAAANAEAGADTIKFDKGLTGAITLTTGEIDITQSLKIVGPGIGKMIVDGNNNSRIFNIDDGTADIQLVSISGLSLVDGNDAGGGAIRSVEALTLDKMSLSNNNSTDDGGALLFQSDGQLVIKNSSFVSNSATNDGGAIFFDGGSGADGLQVVNTLVSGNNANYGGGMALYNGAEGSTMLISKSTIIDNRATNNGGGILADTDVGTLAIKSSTVSGNRGVTGGGLYFDDGRLLVEKSTFSSNVATARGGAIASELVASVDIKSSIFSRNSATNGGGAVLIQGDSDVVNSVSASTFTGNTADTGAAIQAEGDQILNVSSSKFNENSATTNGGAIRAVGAAGGFDLTVSKSTFSNNTAGTAGGGISTDGSSATNFVNLSVISSTFKGNAAGNGGGVDTVGHGDIIVNASKFIENIARNADGGGMYLRTATTATITGSLFQRNTAWDDGGGVALYDSNNTGTFTISKSKFLDNSARDSGGGIMAFTTMSGTITGSTVTGNVAGVGGGIAGDANVTLEKSKVTGNSAFPGPETYGI